MIGGNWLVRVDYRYADFGSMDHTFFPTEPIQSPIAATKISTQTATFGIAYKFAPNG